MSRRVFESRNDCYNPPAVKGVALKKSRVLACRSKSLCDFQTAALRLRFFFRVRRSLTKNRRNGFLIENVSGFQFGLLRFFLRSPICPNPATLPTGLRIY
jgi:hypothetical protein